MIAIYNRTKKTLTIRGYNMYGRVVLKERTQPLPRGQWRQFGEKYTGGAVMSGDEYNLLNNNGLILKTNQDGKC